MIVCDPSRCMFTNYAIRQHAYYIVAMHIDLLKFMHHQEHPRHSIGNEEEYDHAFFFFSSRRRHTRCSRDWSSDVCSSDLSSATLAPSSTTFGTSARCPIPSASRKSNAPPKSAPSKLPVMSCPSPPSPPWCTQIGRASCRERV